MKRLIFILFCLISFSAYAIEMEEVIKIETNTDKFFEICTKDYKQQNIDAGMYCVGFYKGMAWGWIAKMWLADKSCPIPPFSDFATKFNSLFYRNQLNTESATIFNIYKTLDTFCDKQGETK